MLTTSARQTEFLYNRSSGIWFCADNFSVYRVNVKAVSGDERFDDSPLSNTLTVNDPSVEGDGGGARGGVLGGLATFSGWPYDEEDDADDDGVPVRVIRLTESAIHLDWSEYLPPKSLVYYRVVWNSASNPAVRQRLTWFPSGSVIVVVQVVH